MIDLTIDGWRLAFTSRVPAEQLVGKSDPAFIARGEVRRAYYSLDRCDPRTLRCTAYTTGEGSSFWLPVDDPHWAHVDGLSTRY